MCSLGGLAQSPCELTASVTPLFWWHSFREGEEGTVIDLLQRVGLVIFKSRRTEETPVPVQTAPFWYV